MTDMAGHWAEHERRLNQHDHDIRHIYREVRWVRRALSRFMIHMGVEPPGEEE